MAVRWRWRGQSAVWCASPFIMQTALQSYIFSGVQGQLLSVPSFGFHFNYIYQSVGIYSISRSFADWAYSPFFCEEFFKFSYVFTEQLWTALQRSQRVWFRSELWLGHTGGTFTFLSFQPLCGFFHSWSEVQELVRLLGLLDTLF